MPTPLEFLERVLPWPGPDGPGWGNLHYSITKNGKKAWRGAPFKTAAELLDRAQSITMDAGTDIFFCTSIQSQTRTITMKDGRSFVVAERLAKWATALKAIWLDVDVKAPPHGYASKQEAWDAVQKFVTDASLPQPSAIVWSGGGMHVYWFSDRSLTVAEWAPFAEGLKAEAQRLGLRCDYGVTTDASRILRVPGTFNRKTAQPRPVKVAALGADYDFAVDLANLKTIGAPKVTVAVTPAAPFDMTAFQNYKPDPAFAVLGGNLSDGLAREALPLDPTMVIKGCPHFTDAFLNHGKGHGQGLWMLTVLASTWFEDGHMWAKHFSDGYPTYDEAELDKMWGRKLDDRAKSNLGWPQCKSFEAEGCKSCKTCIYRPLDKSPLNLAARVKAPDPTPSPSVVVVDPADLNVVVTAEDLELPDGYVLYDGKVCYVPEPDPKAEEPPKPQPIFYGDVVAKPWTSNGEPCVLHFKYRAGVNPREVVVPYNKTNSDSVLAECLASQTVMTRNDKVVRHFVKSWIARIDDAYKRLTSAPFGWVIENGLMLGFAYGGKLFKIDGTEEDAGYPHKSVQADYSPTGQSAPIFTAMEIVSEQHHPALEVLVLQSWASPLLHFAGLKAIICWGWSNLSAAFKSSAIRTGMALWASPDRAREQKGLTASGLETKLDNLKNLPLVIDEITDETMLEALLPAIQTVPEGGAGTRSTRGGEQRAKKTWAAALICGSNQSMHEYQLLKGATTDAKAARVFEFKVEKRPGYRNETEVLTLISSLDDNFGHLGLLYAKYLAMNYASLKDRYKTIADGVEVSLAPMGKEERYWKATVAMTLLAAEIANEITGQTYFHVDEIRVFLLETFRKNRSWVATFVNVAGEASDSEQTMMRVLDEFMNNTLVTDTILKKGEKHKLVAIQMPPQNAGKGNPIHMQWVVNPPLVRISLPALKEYLGKINVGVNRISDMKKIYGGEDHRKVNMLAGLDILAVKGRVDVWEMPIYEDHPLYAMWHAKAHHGQNVIPANVMSAAAQVQDTPKKVDFEAMVATGLAQAQADAARVNAT